MEKIVVLNSGGYDSISLLNYLYLNGYKDLHCLHFLYGANNEVEQLKCAKRGADRVGATFETISIPPIFWTKNKFYSGDFDHDTQYLEYRNLIFLSFAASYAESIGATKIAVAFLKGGTYKDTSEKFVNSLSSCLDGIEIIVPFINFYKDNPVLLQSNIEMGISTEDYFSCDCPVGGHPCGKCGDCESLVYINDILTIDHPFKAFYQSGKNYNDPLFHKLLSEEPVEEVRALINNDCQLHCKHCFYGFDKMTGEPVSKELYYDSLKEAVLKCGVHNIHFAGKEPLFDDTILYYARRIKEDNLPCTFNLVTNGINVPKYAPVLKELGIEHIAISVDEVFDTNGVRSTHGVIDKAILACNENDIPVEVFIDVHHNNYNRIKDIVKFLFTKYGVKKFYVRTIRSIGNASTMTMLGASELYWVHNQLEVISRKNPEIFIDYSISAEYYAGLMNHAEMSLVISTLDSLYSTMVGENYSLSVEQYCSRYSNTVTLTPDGYLLGCCSEVSLPNYADVSVGNIRDFSIPELINMGKSKITPTCNKNFCGDCTLKKIYETT